MAGYKVEFSKQANKGFLEIVEYLYENWTEKVAKAFQKALFDKLEKLAKNPNLGNPSLKNASIRSILNHKT
jgi:plasmid stabilization system protein ParE